MPGLFDRIGSLFPEATGTVLSISRFSERNEEKD
jgi:hypothetical protein